MVVVVHGWTDAADFSDHICNISACTARLNERERFSVIAIAADAPSVMAPIKIAPPPSPPPLSDRRVDFGSH